MTFLLTTDRVYLDRLKRMYNSYHRYPQIPLDLWMNTVQNMDCVHFLSSLPDSSVDFLCTDEPFGTAETRLNLKARRDITTDFEWDKIVELPEEYKVMLIGSGSEKPRLPMHLLNEWVFEAYRVLKPTGLLLNFGYEEFTGSFRDVCRTAGFTWRASIPWLKVNTAPHFRKNNFRNGHETIFFASKGITKNVINFQEQQEMVNFIIDQRCPNCKATFPVIFSNNYDEPKWYTQVETWECDHFEISPMTNKKTDHDTEKPEWLITKYMEIMSNPGDVVVDPFLGGGTTAVVAKKMKRRYIVNDLNDEYVLKARGRLLSQAESLF